MDRENKIIFGSLVSVLVICVALMLWLSKDMTDEEGREAGQAFVTGYVISRVIR